MNYGIVDISLVPMRAEASDSSEMVNQVLFGEMYEILEKTEKWTRIRTVYDDYVGWIDEKQVFPIKTALFNKCQENQAAFTLDLLHSAISNSDHIPLVLGSSLSFFDGVNFKLGKRKFVFTGQAFNPKENPIDSNLAIKLALKYLNAPYLWGGRSPLGIDCSGLTLNVFKILGIKLKRDAYQQFNAGTTIDFIDQAKSGDLAFFENKEGKITHVGIVYERDASNKEIIHASGKVRIDRLDNHGIYNLETKKYTHSLRMIKRVL